jgi:hypothetical protein
MRLTLGSRHYDLASRALVLGVDGRPEDLVREGADLLEVAGYGRPVCVAASGDATVAPALEQGAVLVRLSAPTRTALEACAAAGAAVIVPAESAGAAAAAAGLPPDRVVPERLLLDVTGSACAVAATAVGVVTGARIVRTADVRGARRICDVLAAVMEAR